MKSDSEEAIPRVFQPKYALTCSVVIALILAYLTYFNRSTIDEMNASSFIYTNIQILVTIFAVTLGVTLLGVQFRAQSYTMLSLMQPIKNPVVYVFVLLFLLLIIFNLYIVIFPHVIDISYSVSLVTIGSIFSLYYLVVYVYHMVKKMEPSMVLDDISKKMKKISWDKNGPCIELNDSKDEIMKPYDIWEQIMIRSIELNNRYMYRKGIDIILKILDEPIKKFSIECIDDPKYKYITCYIESILVSCINTERNRFVDDFFEFIKNKKIDFYIYMWNYIMNTAISRNNFRILVHMDKLKSIFNKNNNLSQSSILTTEKIYSDFVAPIIQRLLTNNQNYSLDIYLLIDRIWYLHINLRDGIHGYPSAPITVWETIMHYNIKTENYHLFDRGMRSISKFLGKYRTESIPNKKQISDLISFSVINIMNNAIKQNSNNVYYKIFFQHFSRHTNEFLPAWKLIMIDSIHNLNTISFKFGLELIKNMLTDKNSTSTDQKINESLNTLKGLYQEYFEHVERNEKISNNLFMQFMTEINAIQSALCHNSLTS